MEHSPNDDLLLEVDRLRALVGPSEVAYEALRRDRDEAQAVARHALADTGRLRGQIEEMAVQLSRARQDQDVLLRRAAMPPIGQVRDRITRRWQTSVAPRIARWTAPLRRRSDRARERSS